MHLLIVHLSDLHLKNTIEYQASKISSMKQRFEQFHDVDTILLLFTGDISFSGEKDQYDAARSFIESLRNAISDSSDGIKRSVLFAMCPGNHDRKMGFDFTRTMLESINAENFDEHIDANRLLNSNYRGFKNEVAPADQEINPLLDYYCFTIKGRKYAVYSLNNSLLSVFYKNGNTGYDDNLGRIMIPDEYLNISRRNEELVFLITHIPLQYFCEKTRDTLTKICGREVDFVFSGHTHHSRLEHSMLNGDQLFEFVAPALYAEGASGFGIYEISNSEVLCTSYGFSKDSRQYEEKGDPSTFSFQVKEATIDSQKINPSFLNSISKIRLDAHHEADFDDIFVFPLLNPENYSSRKSRLAITSFEKFLPRILKNKVFSFSGARGSGKTTLARGLFHDFINDGFVPVLLEGTEIGSSVKHAIEISLKEIYDDRNIVKSFMHLPLNKRVIIIDNLDNVTDRLIHDLLKYAGLVVYFCKPLVHPMKLMETDLSSEISYYKIEPFFYDKRTLLFEKIYKSLGKKNEINIEDLGLDIFLERMKSTLAKLDFENSLYPNYLSALAIQVLTRAEDFSSNGIRSLFHFEIKEKILQVIERGQYKKCDLNIAERILSILAYSLYNEKRNTFHSADVSNAIEVEKENMGNDPIHNIDAFLRLLEEAGIIKIKENDYLFSDRRTFAYFIGKRAVERYHRSSDKSYLDLIISRGIYNPLNFQILLSIATVYEYPNIPSYFVNDIYAETTKEELALKESVTNIDKLFDREKKKLMSLSPTERQKFVQRRSRAEERARTEYLKNIDNYFYEEKVSKNIQRMLEWENKMQIVSVLLNSFATDLTKNDKNRLLDMAIKLPNIVIGYLLINLRQTMDDLFTRAKLSLDETDDAVASFDAVRSYILSLLNAVVLSIYDISTRPLNRSIVSASLYEKLKSTGSTTDTLQRIMLLSFSSNRSLFVKEATSLILEKDVYLSNSVRLIGRRFCLENYDLATKEFPEFIDLVYSGKKSKLIKEKAKRLGPSDQSRKTFKGKIQ